MICILVCLPAIHSQEFKDEEYGGKTGTMYRTRITEDRVNVRDYPSTDGARLGQLNKNDTVIIIGISKDSQIIDSYNGYWLCIQGTVNGNYIDAGWVFSRYVDIKNVNPAEIRFENFCGNILKVSYLLNGRKIFIE